MVEITVGLISSIGRWILFLGFAWWFIKKIDILVNARIQKTVITDILIAHYLRKKAEDENFPLQEKLEEIKGMSKIIEDDLKKEGHVSKLKEKPQKEFDLNLMK